MSVSLEEIRRLVERLPDAAQKVTDRARPGVLRLIREDIACVFDRDPAARNRLEVVTTFPACMP